MRFLRRKEREIDESIDGKVLARITVDKVDSKTRKVKAIVVCRSTGKTVFKLRYTTSKQDIPAYHEAEEYVKKFVKEHDYVIDGRIDTPVQLPYVGNVPGKRMR